MQDECVPQRTHLADVFCPLMQYLCDRSLPWIACVFFGRLFSDDLAEAALHAHCHLIQRGLSGRNTQSLQRISRSCLYCDLCCPRVRYVQCWTQVLQLRLCQHQVLLAAQLDSKRWKRVSAMKAGQPALRDKLLEDGWSVQVEHTLAGLQRLRDGVFMASVKEAKMLMAEMYSNGSLAVLAPITLAEKGAETSVVVRDRNGCMQSRQLFLHQLGDTPVFSRSAVPHGGKVGDGGTKQNVLNLSKLHTGKQGWEAACERVAGREELQVAAQVTSSTFETALRASGVDGVMTRPFHTTKEEKHSSDRYRCLSISRWIGALSKTAWWRNNYSRFSGELWDVSALPLSWSPDAVTDFFAGPLKTFRQGYRRTGVVRS